MSVIEIFIYLSIFMVPSLFADFKSLISFYKPWKHKTSGFLMTSGGIPLGTRRKLKKHNPGRFLIDLCTFNFCPVSRGDRKSGMK